MSFKSMIPKKLLLPKSTDTTDELTEKRPKSSKFQEYVSQDKNGLKAYTKKHRRSPYGKE